MLARTASALNGSAQSSTRISPPAPTASQVRSIVPRLPGSRSACATSHSGAVERSSASSGVGHSRKAPATVCGLSLPVILARIAASVSTTRPPLSATARSSVASSGGRSRPVATTSSSGNRPASRASVSRRSPSARNSPLARRPLRLRSERSSLIVGLENDVTRSSLIPRRSRFRRARRGGRAPRPRQARRRRSRSCPPSPRRASSG